MNRRYRLAWFVPVVVSLFVGVSAAPPDHPSSRSADVELARQIVQPQKLKMHLNFIASDELEGRNTPSRGLDLAARYLVSHLEYYGYQPAGDNGTFYQTIHMSTRRASKDSKLKVESGGRQVELKFGEDFAGLGGSVDGELAFVGYGLQSEQAGYDDYAGVDVNGKVVVLLDGTPDGIDPNLFRVQRRVGNRTFQTPIDRLALARDRGARGIIVIRDGDFAASRDNKPSPFEARVKNLQADRTVLDWLEDSRPFHVDLTAQAGTKLEEVLGFKFADYRAKVAETKKPNALEVKATVNAQLKPEIVEKFTTQNVIAFLEGSDPKLKEEIVLFSAHYDHVGMAPPGNNPNADRIFNGADDDGSGTVGILTLAEAFAAIQRPRRSLLFVWHCGEEKGLWGSDYYVKNPTKPLDKVVANINIDMIGRNSDDKPENSNHVFIIGARRTSQDLVDLVYKVNADRMRLDETDNANYFMRSDHYHYARNRIPVVFFFTGVHKDYHRVTDEVHLVQFDKMKKILDLIFDVGLELANRDARPAFTGQGF